jgi:hypothetical protein
MPYQLASQSDEEDGHPYAPEISVFFKSSGRLSSVY